jgi:hypothetical protein
MEVVEDVLLDVNEDQQFLLPKQSLLKRSTNRHLAKTRPAEPTNLQFIVRIHFFFICTNYSEIRTDLFLSIRK